MIKLVYCITKRADMTEEDFFRYWRDVHGALAKKIPYLCRLVQSYRIDLASHPRTPDFDGMAELWFDNLATLNAARKSPEWAAITQDEANFIDGHKVAFFISTEHEVILDDQW